LAEVPGSRVERDERVVLSGDDVGGRDDEPGSCNPARSLDADPAGRAEHAHDTVRRALDRGILGDAGIRRLARRSRPCDRWERVDPSERVQQLPRRDDLVQAAEDERATGALPEPRLAWPEDRDRTDHPDDRQAGEGAEREPADRVERA
jgi:hypothetical protein